MEATSSQPFLESGLCPCFRLALSNAFAHVVPDQGAANTGGGRLSAQLPLPGCKSEARLSWAGERQISEQGVRLLSAGGPLQTIPQGVRLAVLGVEGVMGRSLWQLTEKN